jgi:hypothetical protein
MSHDKAKVIHHRTGQNRFNGARLIPQKVNKNDSNPRKGLGCPQAVQQISRCRARVSVMDEWLTLVTPLWRSRNEKLWAGRMKYHLWRRLPIGKWFRFLTIDLASRYGGAVYVLPRPNPDHLLDGVSAILVALSRYTSSVFGKKTGHWPSNIPMAG